MMGLVRWVSQHHRWSHSDSNLCHKLDWITLHDTLLCHCQTYKTVNGLTCIKFASHSKIEPSGTITWLSIYPVLAKMYSGILILSMLPLFRIIYHSILFNHIPLLHSNYAVNQFFHPPLLINIHNHNPVISSHITLCVCLCVCVCYWGARK